MRVESRKVRFDELAGMYFFSERLEQRMIDENKIQLPLRGVHHG